MKIAVIGADGMLGSEVTLLLKEKDIDCCPYTVKNLDVTSKETLNVIKENSPNIIINCSAYTAVDKAQEDVETAFAVNSIGVKNLAEVSKEIGAKLVHFSTDYVFSGEAKVPYLELDSTNPIGVYGKSKLAGEEYLKKTLPETQFLLLRTAWLYGAYGNNFVKTMIRLAKEKDEVRVVNDQYGSPTYAKDLATWTFELLLLNQSGIFHATNSGSCSWYQFAKKIFELSGISVKCTAITSNDYVAKVKRPKFSVLNNEKLKKVLDYSIREWTEALSEYLFLTKL